MVELRHRLPNSQSHTMNVLYTLRPSNGPKQWTRERHEKSDRRQNELEPKKKGKTRMTEFVCSFCAESFLFFVCNNCRVSYGRWVSEDDYIQFDFPTANNNKKSTRKKNKTFFQLIFVSSAFLHFSIWDLRQIGSNVFRSMYSGHKSTMPTGYSFRFLADNVAFNTIY